MLRIIEDRSLICKNCAFYGWENAEFEFYAGHCILSQENESHCFSNGNCYFQPVISIEDTGGKK